jgi:putative flippase GtrA
MKQRLKALPELKKQLIKFTAIGIFAVLVDLVCYYLFLNTLPERPLNISTEAVSKSLSFVCGSIVTYNLNKFWTWRKRDRSNKRFVKFMMLYGTSLILNVITNSVALYVLHEIREVIDFPFKYLIAFVAATGASAVFNFVGQKLWVFRVGSGKEERDLFDESAG